MSRDPFDPFNDGGFGGNPGGFNPPPDWCEIDPTFCGPIIVTQPPPTTVTEPSTTVTVNNAINISADTLSSIADAIHTAINQSADEAAGFTNDIIDAITGTISKATTGIFNGVNSAFGTIGTFLSNIGNWVVTHVDKLVDFITNNIGKVIDTIKSVITDYVEPALAKITTFIDTVNKTLNDTIIPIFNAISQTYNQTVALITAIQKDVNNGLQGILQLPSDISSALSGVEGALDRLQSQLGGKLDDSLRTTIGGTASDTIHTRLAALHDALAATVSSKLGGTTFADTVKLGEPKISDIMRQALVTANHEGEEVTQVFVEVFGAMVKHFKEGMGGLQYIVGDMVEGAVWLAILFFVYSAEIWPLGKFILGQAYTRLPLEKLSPADALEAWRRSFIDSTDLNAELSTQGYDNGRIRTLMDLESYLASINDVIDWWHRGIITDEDLKANLSSHGAEDEDQAAIKAASFKLFSVAEATRAWSYFAITDDQLKDVLKVNRYTDAQIDAYFAGLRRPENITEAIERHFREQLAATGLLSDKESLLTPAAILNAAHTMGVDEHVAETTYRESWQVPNIEHWISLYFRGMRTRNELDNIFEYFRVPREWRQDYIDVRRSLIPWRTIPTMLANGLITEAYAKEQLQAHGYDLAAAEALLKFASLAKKKSTAQASGDLHSVSVGNAKSFWSMGAITDQQYHDILLAHGYDEATATLTMNAERMAEHVKERRLLSQQIVDEVLAGLLTVDDARTAMSNNQFSTAEQAHVLRQIDRVKRGNAKTPGEGDLHAMASKGAITVDQYREAMAINGYSPTWIESFVKWRFPDVAKSPA